MSEFLNHLAKGIAVKDFFYPESVAVVGVSASPANLARAIVYHLIEFHYTGRILPQTPEDERRQIFGTQVIDHK
jgi:acyl-CoA synthetase (NDP forming)